MDLYPIYQTIILATVCASAVVYGGAFIYHTYYLPRRRKHFLLREMARALSSRAHLYDTSLIQHCHDVLLHIEEYCTMRDGFKMVYTYGSWEIGVNWYPVNGLFEFTTHNNFQTIAKIHYPT